jgi:hypothetical protein
MQTRWQDWVHVTVSTYGTWLPGDPRGFRDHDHRVHSSGDYRHRPPEGEHVGLHRLAREAVGAEVHLPPHLRKIVAEVIAEKLAACGVAVRIAAVAKTHAHILARVGNVDAKPIIGRAEQAASHRVRDELPGTIWSQGCGVVRVESETQYRRVVAYIERHRNEGAFVWIHPQFGINPDLRKPSGQASECRDHPLA